MQRVLVLALCLSLAFGFWGSEEDTLDALDASDVNKGFKPMVRGHGFDVEEHYVITEDKYILSIFRICEPGTQN